MHEDGFVHSDIKFENVFLEEVAHGRCSAKLSDFGLAYRDAVCLCLHLPNFPARRSRIRQFRDIYGTILLLW